jgi:hypothetical protein
VGALGANRRTAAAKVGRLHEHAVQQRKNALHDYSSALQGRTPVLVLATLATKAPDGQPAAGAADR